MSMKTKKVFIGVESDGIVSGRELYSKLEIKTPFADWINKKIKRLNLENKKDYYKEKMVDNMVGRKRFDYILTLETAEKINASSRGIIQVVLKPKEEIAKLKRYKAETVEELKKEEGDVFQKTQLKDKFEIKKDDINPLDLLYNNQRLIEKLLFKYDLSKKETLNIAVKITSKMTNFDFSVLDSYIK